VSSANARHTDVHGRPGNLGVPRRGRPEHRRRRRRPRQPCDRVHGRRQTRPRPPHTVTSRCSAAGPPIAGRRSAST